jgi:Tfp pilus assembly protein PilO
MINALTWPAWKKWTSGVLGVLLLLDLGLGVYLWQGSRQDPGAMRVERDRLVRQAKLLRADVDRGEKIRVSLPQAGKQADDFYRQSFLGSNTGYSQIESDLAAIASHAGVRASALTFKEKEVKDRGVTEVQITTSIDGNYPAMIQFINGLERSKNFYLLDHLQLASATNGGLRLELDLHTFFRT